MTEPNWKRRFRVPRAGFPTWARDRPDRLTYGSNISGAFEVHTWDRSSNEHRQATDNPDGTRNSRIDPTGEFIWWFDDGRGSEFGIWRSQPFEGGDATAATDLAASYSGGVALGSGLAVVGCSGDDGASVYVVREGKSTQIYSHREHALVRGISSDDRLIALSHSEHGDSRNFALRILDTEGVKVSEVWDGPGKGLMPGAWSSVRGDQRLLVSHERSDVSRPMIFDARTGAERQLRLDLAGEVSASWYPDAKALLLIHDHRGRSEMYRYDLLTDELERRPTDEGSILQARVRPDGEIWYQSSTSSAAPAIKRVGSGVVLRLSEEEVPTGVSYTDHEVEGIHVFVAEPAGQRPHPTIFMVHGGPEMHDRDSFHPGVQAWVDHGYAVVMANYRGSAGYGKAWRDAIKGNIGLTELADIEIVRRWAVDSGLADSKRLILAGASWGGYLTLLGLGTQPDFWAVGLAGVPVGDYVTAFEDELEWLKRWDVAMFGGTPAEVPDEYRKRSPITYVEGLKAPVLIMAGENDANCPIRQVENYVRALEQHGKPHQFYRYDAGHGSGRLEEQLAQLELQLSFAAQHLGTQPPIE